MRPIRHLRTYRPCFLAAVVLCSVFALVACAQADAPSLKEARQFTAFRIYYPGDEVAGLPLENVSGQDWKPDATEVRWTFIFGQCQLPDGSESSCFPPLQVHDYSICVRSPTSFNTPPKLFAFRGAKATGSGRIEDPLEIFTGRTTIVISAKQAKVAMTAARRLRDVRQTRPTDGLPAPVAGSLQGRLPCQQKPG